MQMRYSRTRSRQDANNFQTLKYGDVSDTTLSEYIINGPREGKTSGAVPDTVYEASHGVPMNASGVSTYYSGSRWWYNNIDLFNRTKTYEGAFIAAKMAEMQASRINLLSGTSAPYLIMEGSRTMTDVVTPEFEELKSAGSIISNPMTSSSNFAVSSVALGGTGFSTPIITWADLGRTNLGTYQLSRHRLYVQFGVHFRPFGIPSDVLSDFRNQLDMSLLVGTSAINQSHSNVYQAEADLALFILEANKTVSHLALTASRIASIVRKIKRGNFKDLAPNTFKRWKSSKGQGIATDSNIFLDAWLEARYAWRPLLLDARDAINYLNKQSSGSRRTFRGYDGDEQTDTDFQYSVTSGSYSYTFNGVLTTDKSVRAGVLTEINPDIQLGRDLGFNNPLGLLWELVPYSFVVDWFVDVSGFIASHNPASWLKILTSWATYNTDVSFVGTCEITNLSTSESKTVDFRLSQKNRKRDIDTSPSYINFDVNFDVYKLVDSVALMRRFKR